MKEGDAGRAQEIGRMVAKTGDGVGGHHSGYGFDNTEDSRLVTVEFVLLSVYPERYVGSRATTQK